MPLTPYQEEVARLLSANRTYDSYLAGGAAIHLEPHTTRYSNDLDYFHDSVERVAEAFLQDQGRLIESGHQVAVEMRLPGYLRATVSRRAEATKVAWEHDSAWRFMPTLATKSSATSSTRSTWRSTSCSPWLDATSRATFLTSSSCTTAL